MSERGCRYIAYEKSLQELKQLRKAALPAQQTDTTLERAILRRVHFVYERATRRFKGELRLWNSWLDFCMATEASRRFSKVFCCWTHPLPQQQPSARLMLLQDLHA